MLIYLVSGVRDLCVEVWSQVLGTYVLIYLVSGVRDLCVEVWSQVLGTYVLIYLVSGVRDKHSWSFTSTHGASQALVEFARPVCTTSLHDQFAHRVCT